MYYNFSKSKKDILDIMSTEIINTRKELHDLSLEEEFNDFYNYSEPPPQILEAVFCGPKLTSINNFFHWWRWLTTTIKSFQCVIDYKDIVKNGNKSRKYHFSYFTEILIKSLLLNSIVKDKNGGNFWRSGRSNKLTSAEIIISVLENYSFILPHEEIKILNSNFTLDKNVKLATKLKEWERLQFINKINDHQLPKIQIVSNFRLYALENDLVYEGIDDIKVPIIFIKKFYRHLHLTKRNLSTNKGKYNPMNKLSIEQNNGLRNNSAFTNNNFNNSNIVLKNQKQSLIEGLKKSKKKFKTKKKKIKVDKKDNYNNNQQIKIKVNKDQKASKPESESRSICHDCHGRHKTKLCPNLAQCPKCHIRHPSQMLVCPSKKTNRKYKKMNKKKGKKEP